MLHPTVLWRLTNDAGGVATCRFVIGGGTYELHITIGEQRYSERAETLGEALLRAAEVEQTMIEQGWRECPAADTHLPWRSDPHAARRDRAGGRERRGAQRARPGPLRVVLQRDCEGILMNISETGALVQVARAQQVGSTVRLAMDWEGSTVHLGGRVVRCASPEAEGPPTVGRHHYVAVAFGELPIETMVTLSVIVRIEGTGGETPGGRTS